jgi:hypothetical protein
VLWLDEMPVALHQRQNVTLDIGCSPGPKRVTANSCISTDLLVISNVAMGLSPWDETCLFHCVNTSIILDSIKMTKRLLKESGGLKVALKLPSSIIEA